VAITRIDNIACVSFREWCCCVLGYLWLLDQRSQYAHSGATHTVARWGCSILWPGTSTIGVADTYGNTWQPAIDYVGTNRVVVLYAEDIAGGAGHQITVTLRRGGIFPMLRDRGGRLLSTGSLDVSASDSTSDAAYSSGPATLTASLRICDRRPCICQHDGG